MRNIQFGLSRVCVLSKLHYTLSLMLCCVNTPDRFFCYLDPPQLRWKSWKFNFAWVPTNFWWFPVKQTYPILSHRLVLVQKIGQWPFRSFSMGLTMKKLLCNQEISWKLEEIKRRKSSRKYTESIIEWKGEKRKSCSIYTENIDVYHFNWINKPSLYILIVFLTH